VRLYRVKSMVTSQIKTECLVGKGLLLCERAGNGGQEECVAVDLIGTAVGSSVLVSRKLAVNAGNDYCDEYVIAIVDEPSRK